MGISIGNVNTNEWCQYKPFPVDNIKKEDDLQEKYFISIDEKLIFNKKFKFIKIDLFENHGEIRDDHSKFLIYRLVLFGVRH